MGPDSDRHGPCCYCCCCCCCCRRCTCCILQMLFYSHVMQFLVSFIKLNMKPVLAVRNDIVFNPQPTHPPFRPLQKNKIYAKTMRFEKKISSTHTFLSTPPSEVIYSCPETKYFKKISYRNFSGLILKLELSVNYTCVIILSWLVGIVFKCSAILLSLM